MDSRLVDLQSHGSFHSFNYSDRGRPILSSQNIFDAVKLEDLSLSPKFVNPPLFSPNPNYHGDESGANQNDDDYDFSDVVLKYISQVLMEEDADEKVFTFHGPSALEATEKSLYEAIGQNYPPPENNNPRGFPKVEVASPDENDAEECVSSISSTSSRADLLTDSSVSALTVSDIFNDSESMSQFRKGVEEANKFLPHGPSYARDMAVELQNYHENQYLADVLRGRKHRQRNDSCLEEWRGNKQSAVSSEGVVRSEMFDMVLLCSKGRYEAALRESWQHSMNKSMDNDQSKGSNGRKGRGRKKGRKKDVVQVDLSSLLSFCAQAVSSNDQRSAKNLLKQIRQHSSPSGDGNQRMAHYFADGLEARVAGVEPPMCSFILNGPRSAADMLRAYHLFLTACPFKKLSNFFANKTIMNVAESAKKIHIVDFGILYGFQWPCLIQRLSSRPGGPPKLRITGIDVPQLGFRPAKRVKETGHRLSNYAESFNVPFEFNAIAKKWETVTEDDLNIHDDEVLIVNSLYRFKSLHDETVMVESPRNMVLNLIRKIKPEVFILGVVNGAYNAPFFITRFREALFHFSTLFDMLEATVPHDVEERMLLERELFGYQVMNAIACEGFERIERPETYKQWHVRNERAGFRPLPLNQEIVNTAKERVDASYHRDFMIDEDGQWLMQGWKGRILFAISSWKAAQ
ncbi:hypothetical protein Dimus_033848 [Dionaea muscipula]